jgi:hypothetical protein
MLAKPVYQIGVQNFLSIIQDPNLCISWSQFGEDTVITEWLSGNHSHSFSNYYVDIGAYHPSRFSNTKLLNLMGWRGINVDANPDSVKLFDSQRPNDINLNFGIASTEREQTIYCFREGAINTFDPEVAKKLVKQGWEFVGKQLVKCISINTLMETYLPLEIKNVGIGFLDIDCEGLDAEIVLSLDLERYRPYIISVEAHSFNVAEALNNSVVQFLVSSGYKLGAYMGLTLLFRRDV